MSRTLSVTARAAANSEDTSEVFLTLLTIDHDSLAAPIRVSSDSVDTVSNGNTFIAFPFNLALPDDTDNASPRARLTIDNIDRTIVEAVRSINTAATVLIQIVLASDPDTVEISFIDFKLTNITYDDIVVTGDLTVENFTAEPFPSATFSPSLFPGIYQ